jgi:hypothetical protein
VTEMTRERLAAAVLEQEDRLPHCPPGFVQRGRPRHSKGRGLPPAGPAEMARTVLKGEGRDEWSAAAGAERFGDRTGLTPTTAADEGAALGIQRAVTDSARGGKDKME